MFDLNLGKLDTPKYLSQNETNPKTNISQGLGFLGLMLLGFHLTVTGARSAKGRKSM